MGTKLYVGNLSFKVTNDGLEELFSQFGEVRSAEVVQDRETGRSRGFGFVEMVDSAGAQAAITALHDKPHEGRPLVVNEARPREDRGPRGGGGGGGGGRYSPYAGGGAGGGGRR
jgi:cold-inducible RNA-binding protein